MLPVRFKCLNRWVVFVLEARLSSNKAFCFDALWAVFAESCSACISFPVTVTMPTKVHFVRLKWREIILMTCGIKIGIGV